MISPNTPIDFQTMLDYKINRVRDVLGDNPYDVTKHLGKVVSVSKKQITSGVFDQRLDGYPDDIDCVVVDGMPGVFAGGGIGWGEGLILSILAGPKKGNIIFTREKMININP